MPTVAKLELARNYWDEMGRGHAQIVPYQAFLCADGEYLMIGAFTRGFWHSLCRALGHEEWITDPKYATNPARLANRAELVGKLEAIFATKTRDEWSEIITRADGCTIVRSVDALPAATRLLVQHLQACATARRSAA